MLYISRKYETLNDILNSYNTSEAYTIGADFKESDVIEMFKNINKNISENDLVTLGNFVNLLYNHWHKSFKVKDDPKLIPFRFDNTKKIVNISRAYKSFLSREGYTTDKFTIGGITFKYGDGSLYSSRAEQGLAYENSIIGELKKLIETVSNNKSKRKRLSADEIVKISGDEQLRHIVPIYSSGTLDNAVEEYKNGKPIDSLVISTGKVDPRRNKNHELWTNDFGITDGDMEKVLTASGKIISDATITTQPETYISVKIESAQLSGVFCSNILKNNKTLVNAAINNEEYSSIEDSQDMLAFKNFCISIGADQQDLYNKYRSLYNGDKITTDIKKSSDEYDSRLLGIVFQKLIGGNYWYVKPSTSIFVPSHDLNLRFIRDRLYITPTGKKIIAFGNVNGIDARIELRTAGEGNLPYRVFPVVSVPALLDSIINKAYK